MLIIEYRSKIFIYKLRNKLYKTYKNGTTIMNINSLINFN